MAEALAGCVSSLRSSMQLLDSSIATLDAGVNDFPRLAKVLQITRHFELISETDLQSAQSALRSEIKPEIESLLARVSAYLDKLERREQSLIAKCDLQEGRLNRAPADTRGTSSSSSATPAVMRKASDGGGGGSRKSLASDAGTGAGAGAGAPLEELKMKQMRQKKERLSYAVDRLTLQAQQKERELRKSMAAQ